HCSGKHATPSRPISSDARWRDSIVRAQIASEAPAPAMALAMARPMPWFPPVTTATFPSRALGPAVGALKIEVCRPGDGKGFPRAWHTMSTLVSSCQYRPRWSLFWSTRVEQDGKTPIDHLVLAVS